MRSQKYTSTRDTSFLFDRGHNETTIEHREHMGNIPNRVFFVMCLPLATKLHGAKERIVVFKWSEIIMMFFGKLQVFVVKFL
jgi:hypothetical protein